MDMNGSAQIPLDLLIVGAGISGIGMAAKLATDLHHHLGLR